MIHAVSQTTGAERTVAVDTSANGLALAISESNQELARAEVPADQLLTILSDRPESSHAVGALRIEIRRNEVLLSAGTADAAVGLDDLMDAVAAAIPSE